MFQKSDTILVQSVDDIQYQISDQIDRQVQKELRAQIDFKMWHLLSFTIGTPVFNQVTKQCLEMKYERTT